MQLARGVPRTRADQEGCTAGCIWLGKMHIWLGRDPSPGAAGEGCTARCVFDVVRSKSSKNTSVFEVFAHPARRHPLRERFSLSGLRQIAI